MHGHESKAYFKLPIHIKIKKVVKDRVQKKAIILNHMFTGNFLNKNIGHEVINLFTDDKQKNFIYLCKDGAYNRTDIDLKNSFVVQVQRPAKSNSTLEIISIADGLSLVDNNFSESNPEPTYGGIPVSKIFANNVQKQDRYLTFRAKRIYIPKEPILIYHGKEDAKSTDVHLEDCNPSQTLREYILEGSNDYDELCRIMPVTDKDKWEIRDASKSKVGKKSCKLLATDIYGIQTRELSYSNALGYYIEQYPELFRDIFKELSSGNQLEGRPIVYREWKNIDLIVNWDEYVFVIENKICSDINGVQANGKTQLEKYQDIMEAAVKEKDCAFNGKTPVYIFLTPDHNDISLLNKEWKKITYSKLWKTLNDGTKLHPYKEDYLFNDFVKALGDQASKNLNASIMERKFRNAIQSVKNAKNQI